VTFRSGDSRRRFGDLLSSPSLLSNDPNPFVPVCPLEESLGFRPLSSRAELVGEPLTPMLLLVALVVRGVDPASTMTSLVFGEMSAYLPGWSGKEPLRLRLAVLEPLADTDPSTEPVLPAALSLVRSDPDGVVLDLPLLLGVVLVPLTVCSETVPL